MQPYFHPTSVTIIDDDRNFLESFAFYLSDDFLCKTFMRPEEGLHHILNQERMRSRAHEFFTDPGSSISGSKALNKDTYVKWDTSKIDDIIKSPSRFDHVSVSIVDFDMPGMNGVEVCRQLSNLPIKKVLLTGKTGIDTAISAFNEGIIDCFLTKQDNNLTNKIHSELLRLQRLYFENIATLIKPIECLNELHFLNDPAFQDIFERLVQNRNIDEYYLSTDPSGMLLLQKNGSLDFLYINTDDTLNERIHNAEKLNAPSQLIELMKSKQISTIFPTSDGHYSNQFKQDWRNYIWPAEQLLGERQTWYYSLIDSDTLPEALTSDVASYNEYIDDCEY